VVVVYPSRRVEQEQAYQFGDLLALERVTRIYLDEMEAGTSLGVGIVKLIVEKEATAPAMARDLLQKATQASLDERKREEIFDIIEAIVVYKFPKKSRQEIARMLGIEDLKQTRFYQEVFAEGREEGIQEGRQEGKQETLSKMLDAGFDWETIAQILDLPLDVVRQEAKKRR
jgi:predicted transposase/invertase (TIGR01784 family)